jgi:hypothetical protein
MKSKLEEKKLELAEKHEQERNFGIMPENYDSYAAINFSSGFDAGITAYKEMLEGVGVEGANQYKLGRDYDGDYASLVVGEYKNYGFDTDDLLVIEALPVLAKLQQQAEKIEVLEYVNETKTMQIKQLESRLKEALTYIKTEHDEDCLDKDDIFNENESCECGAIARIQYMEKVK